MNEASIPDVPWFPIAQEFMSAVYGVVRLERLYPQWTRRQKEPDLRAHEAAKALLAAAPRVEFAVAEPGLRVNGASIDPLRGGEIVWDFAGMLASRLIGGLTLTAGISAREIGSIARELAAPADPAKMPPNHWERFLKRESVSHVSISQRAHMYDSEGETVVMLAGQLVGDRPLDPEQSQALAGALGSLRAAVHELRRSPPDHPTVEAATGQAIDALASLLSRVRVLTFAVRDEALLVNGQRHGAEEAGFLAAEMALKGFTAFTIKDGLTADEAYALVSILAIPPDDPEAAVLARRILGSNNVRRFVVTGAGRDAAAAAAPAGPAAPAPPKAKGAPLEARARELLKAPARQFASDDGKATFVRVLQAGLDPSAPLVERLTELMNDGEAEVRHEALSMVRRALREMKGDPLAQLLSGTCDAMAARAMAETDPAVHPMLAETIHLWLLVAILSQQTMLAAQVIRGGIAPALASPALADEFRTALRSKLRLVGQGAGSAVFQLLVKGGGLVREDALLLLRYVGESMMLLLGQLKDASPDEGVRRAAEQAIQAITAR